MPIYSCNVEIPALYRNGLVPRLLSAAKEGEERRYLRAMHAHQDRVELILLVRGSGVFQIDRIRYSAARMDLLIYNAGVLHEEFMPAQSGQQVLALGIGGLFLEGLPDNTILDPRLHPLMTLEASDYELLLPLFENIYRCVHALQKRQPESAAEAGRRAALAAEAQACMEAVVALVCRLGQSQDKLSFKEESTLGSEIKALLDRSYLEDCTIQELAKRLPIAPSHMTHIFKRQMGLSPQQYIIRRRIGQAQSLLLNSTASVSEIALSCGYNSPNFFSSSFSALLGLSPVQYRQLYCRLP